MLKLRKNKKGFTLVELIVVIAIMAVLAGTIAGVTVSQLNKQTNNTAKSEAQTLASDLHNFMIDYQLPTTQPAKIPGTDTAFTMVGTEQWDSKAIDTVSELAYAVYAFVDENNQRENIEVIRVGDTDVTAAPTDNNSIKGTDKDFKAGGHKFYAFVYETIEVVGKDDNGNDKTEPRYKVRFCCKQKGNGQNQFPFADYTYGDVLADNN